tara:strand:- start:4004 stop:5080 length:1077 start_codon:yes stop_codon:yes gene_type:complete
MNNLVLVAMSGGVDSSVALSKILDNGYKAIGITMKLWDNKDPKTNAIKPSLCNSVDAISGAKLICDRFGVKHYTVNFMDLFKKHVIDDFSKQYLNGKTPNPCVKCNSIIKWSALLEFGNDIGAAYIATGHYARIDKNENNFMIKKAKDREKDQSYMLWDIDKKQLKRTIFPIGNMTKSEVREYATKNNLETAKREESQDLCFVLGDDYNQFLHEIMPEKMANITNGPIKDETGAIVGEHKGFTNYTIGQRRGIGVSFPEPRYVKKINPINNTLTISKKESLYSNNCIAHKMNFFKNNLRFPIKLDAKIRYNSKSSTAIINKKNGELKINFKDPQLAITPGQSIVFYQNEYLIGGAIIK